MDKQIEYLESKIISKKNRFLITDSEKEKLKIFLKIQMSLLPVQLGPSVNILL